jgi:ABC-type uncharacterized transport system permease subunit
MTNSFYVAAHAVVAAVYFAAAWRVWRLLRAETPIAAGWADWPVPVLVVLHGGLLSLSIFGAGGELHFGFAQALSATLWLTVLLLWLEGFFVPMRGLHPLVLPAAGVAAALPAVFHGAVIASAAHSAALRLHLLVAISAYSLLTIAALHALLMAAFDRQLHAAALDRDRPAQRLFRHAPPLLAMENQLFRVILAGFVLLTATVVSGLFFSEALFGKPLRFEHKTVLAIAAWLVFGGLVVGRSIFGWRGRIALRWTLAGFVMLLLAYVGSRFVLEVILQRY